MITDMQQADALITALTKRIDALEAQAQKDTRTIEALLRGDADELRSERAMRGIDDAAADEEKPE